MFGKLFGRKPEPQSAAANESPGVRALRETIVTGRARDPLIGAKVGAKLVNNYLIQAATGERGVHVESLLVSLGALGGFACQMTARHLLRSAPDPTWQAPVVEIGGADGRTYYSGDAINHALLKGPMSLWSVAAGIIAQISDQPLPDPIPIFAHVAATIGGPEFGVIRYPPGTSAGDTPLNYVRAFWPPAQQSLQAHAIGPEEWPALFGIAAQEDLAAAKNVIAPTTGLCLFMESAVAMSRIDPAEIGPAPAS